MWPYENENAQCCSRHSETGTLTPGKLQISLGSHLAIGHSFNYFLVTVYAHLTP